jgi:hypothetical protein
MLKLNLPPTEEVRDIVLDMMPTVAPGAAPATLQKSIHLAESLVALFHIAVSTAATEAVLKTMLSGMISTPDFDDCDLY